MIDIYHELMGNFFVKFNYILTYEKHTLRLDSNQESEVLVDLRTIVALTEILLPVHGALFDSLIQNLQSPPQRYSTHDSKADEYTVTGEGNSITRFCGGRIQISVPD